MMAKRILVPLDLTEDTEAVAPLVADLARGSGATVRLLHVAPIPEEQRAEYGRVIAYVDQEMFRLDSEGREALGTVAAQLEGVPVETVVRFGEAAEEILTEAEAFDADVIVLSKARAGRAAWLLGGGVAGRVLRTSPLPVLLLRRPAALARVA